MLQKRMGLHPGQYDSAAVCAHGAYTGALHGDGASRNPALPVPHETALAAAGLVGAWAWEVIVVRDVSAPPDFVAATRCRN
mmetsp:Transcript_62266/g.85994  ORF Transcript_62266/g.85994 Transcript_62266/m.85994 type:complete len:81 (-) Transcript_62266:168-410(-)